MRYDALLALGAARHPAFARLPGERLVRQPEVDTEAATRYAAVQPFGKTLCAERLSQPSHCRRGKRHEG